MTSATAKALASTQTVPVWIQFHPLTPDLPGPPPSCQVAFLFLCVLGVGDIPLNRMR